MTEARGDWDEELHYRKDAIRGSRKLLIAMMRVAAKQVKPVVRPAPPPECPKIAAIQKAVCKRYRITQKQLLARKRKHRFVVPRQLAMYLARTTGASLPKIGRHFKRDHTTVLHAIRAVENDWSMMLELRGLAPVDTGDSRILPMRNSLENGRTNREMTQGKLAA